jgi:hypothetical protein
VRRARRQAIQRIPETLNQGRMARGIPRMAREEGRRRRFWARMEIERTVVARRRSQA